MNGEEPEAEAVRLDRVSETEARIAVELGLSRPQEIERAIALYIEWQREGRQIDLAEAIAEVANWKQKDVTLVRERAKERLLASREPTVPSAGGNGAPSAPALAGAGGDVPQPSPGPPRTLPGGDGPTRRAPTPKRRAWATTRIGFRSFLVSGLLFLVLGVALGFFVFPPGKGLSTPGDGASASSPVLGQPPLSDPASPRGAATRPRTLRVSETPDAAVLALVETETLVRYLEGRGGEIQALFAELGRRMPDHPFYEGRESWLRQLGGEPEGLVPKGGR